MNSQPVIEPVPMLEQTWSYCSVDPEPEAPPDYPLTFDAQVNAILRKKEMHSTWVMKSAFEGVEDNLARVVEANLKDPRFGFVDPPEPSIDLSSRVKGGADDELGEAMLRPPEPRKSMLAPVTEAVDRGLARASDAVSQLDGFLESQGLVRAGVENKAHMSPFLKAKLEAKFKLKLAQRVRGGDEEPAAEDAPPADVEGGGDGDGGDEGGEEGEEGEEEEVTVMELSEEDQAIMDAEIVVDKALLKGQSGNSGVVKLFNKLAEDLLEKVDLEIDPKFMTAMDAIELFCGVICDLVYVQVALVLCPQIMKTIKMIKYTPEGEDVALVLPNIMKNMLQGAVDDMIEGKVREQVEALVRKCIKGAAKMFKKMLPAVPTMDSLRGDGDDDDDEDGDGKIGRAHV
jgi:hypothetical protein